MSEEHVLADDLLKKNRKRKADFKKPDLRKWAEHIGRMIRLDGRSPSAIRELIAFCQADAFWQNNILSAEKLRKQFDQLELKMRSDHGHKTHIEDFTPQPPGRSDVVIVND